MEISGLGWILFWAPCPQGSGHCEDESSYFIWFNAGVDPHDFLDSVYKVLSDMGVKSTEKEELASYKLREVAKVMYTE